MTEHDARILSDKTRPVKDRDALQRYADLHYFCAGCGCEDKPRQLHHIIGGRGGRSDEAVNLLSLCFDICHPFADNSRNLGVVLTWKIRVDGLTAADLARLAVLHGRTLPTPEPIPELFRILYTKHREGR